MAVMLAHERASQRRPFGVLRKCSFCVRHVSPPDAIGIVDCASGGCRIGVSDGISTTAAIGCQTMKAAHVMGLLLVFALLVAAGCGAPPSVATYAGDEETFTIELGTNRGWLTVDGDNVVRLSETAEDGTDHVRPLMVVLNRKRVAWMARHADGAPQRAGKCSLQLNAALDDDRWRRILRSTARARYSHFQLPNGTAFDLLVGGPADLKPREATNVMSVRVDPSGTTLELWRGADMSKTTSTVDNVAASVRELCGADADSHCFERAIVSTDDVPFGQVTMVLDALSTQAESPILSLVRPDAAKSARRPSIPLRGSVSSAPASLPAAKIQAVVRARLGGVRKCYAQALRRNRNLAGGVRILFAIGIGGTVLRAEIASSPEPEKIGLPSSGPSLTDEGMHRCLVSHFRKLRFPAGDEGKEVTVSYPLVFTPTGR